MKKALLVFGWLWLVVCLTGGARAQKLPPQYPEGPAAGLELAAQLRDLFPEEDATWQGSLKVRPRGAAPVSTPVQCRVTRGDGEWRVTYETQAIRSQGAEQLTVIHRTNSPNQYLYAHAATPAETLGAAAPLANPEADRPLAGSDFWLSELGFEFYHWPKQNRLTGKMRRSRPCLVLESSNPAAGPGGLARVLTYIDIETRQPILAEAYGPDGKLLKEFSLGHLAKVNGKWVVKDLEISNRQTGSRTWLEFDTAEK